MKLSEEFKFLNVQSVKRKNVEGLKPEEQYFYIINLLDKENNPVKFYSFDNSLNTEINWNVRLEDLKIKY